MVRGRSIILIDGPEMSNVPVSDCGSIDQTIDLVLKRAPVAGPVGAEATTPVRGIRVSPTSLVRTFLVPALLPCRLLTRTRKFLDGHR